jgi:hypothetical protein
VAKDDPEDLAADIRAGIDELFAMVVRLAREVDEARADAARMRRCLGELVDAVNRCGTPVPDAILNVVMWASRLYRAHDVP